MKRILTPIILFFIFNVNLEITFAQTNIVSWNFADGNNIADGGLSLNASRTITENTPATQSFPTGTSGSCSGGYILSSMWNDGADSKYWQLNFETTGYQNLELSFDVRSSGTGPRDFKVQYSIISESSGFSDVSSGDYQVLLTTCDTKTITLPTDCNNRANVYLRLIMTSNTSQNSGTVASAGTNGIDNILVESSTVLPIKLSRFDVKYINNTSLLNWITLSEINNSYFLIEHSMDGKRFTEIGNLSGSGNSSREVNYEFTHNHPSVGINYYRLTQVDFDGKSETFDVRWVKVEKQNNLKIYPYQVKDNLFIDGLEDSESIFVYNSIGSMMHEYNNVESIDMSNYLSGIYLIKVGEVIQKVVKN